MCIPKGLRGSNMGSRVPKRSQHFSPHVEWWMSNILLTNFQATAPFTFKKWVKNDHVVQKCRIFSVFKGSNSNFFGLRGFIRYQCPCQSQKNKSLKIHTFHTSHVLDLLSPELRTSFSPKYDQQILKFRRF